MKMINYKLSKELRIAFWIIISVLFIVVVSVLGGWYLQKRIPDFLKSAVHEKSQGQYKLEFDKISVSLLSGNLSLEGVKLIIDTQAYISNVTPESSDKLFQISANQLSFSGINIIGFLAKKKISMKGIQLENPDIVLFKMRESVQKDSVEKSIYERIPEFLKGAKLSSLRVNELSFSERTLGSWKDSVNKLSGLSFSVEDLRLDSARIKDSTFVWFSKDIKVHSRSIKYTLADGMSFLKAEKVDISTKNRTLEVEAFKVIPLYKELEFSQKLGRQGDRFNILIPLVKANNFDFKKLENEGKVFMKNMIIENGHVLIFRNKKMPAEKKNSIQNAPQLALQRLKIPVSIDSVKLKGFEIHYRELNPESDEIGDVFFTNLQGMVTNITNDAESIKRNNWLKSNFSMNFLDHAAINLNLNFRLDSKVGEFNYKGTLGSANASYYNQLLEPIAMFKVESGHIDKISFDVKGNINGSSGTVQALYKDLKISALVKEDGGKIGREGMLSFIANRFLIIHSNPELGQAARLSHFTYSHPPTQSFFNLMWKSIFTGLKANIIEDKTEKKAQKKLAREKRREERKLEKQAKKEAENKERLGRD